MDIRLIQTLSQLFMKSFYNPNEVSRKKKKLLEAKPKSL